MYHAIWLLVQTKSKRRLKSVLSLLFINVLIKNNEQCNYLNLIDLNGVCIISNLAVLSGVAQ